MKRTIIFVEGTHDAEVVARILKIKGFSHLRKKSVVDIFWHKIIPKIFPPNDDLLERIPVPMFYKNGESEVALYSCNGISKIEAAYKNIRDSVYVQFSGISSVYVIVDCDNRPEADVRKEIVNLLSFPVSDKSILNVQGVNYGLYILPNNSDKGTIEKLLLECAEIQYTAVLNNAKNFVDTIDFTKLSNEDKKEIEKPFGKEKAILGAVATILKPAKSLPVSICDNEWITDKTMTQKTLSELADYIGQCL